MFRPSGGHHQVVLLKLKLIQYVRLSGCVVRTLCTGEKFERYLADLRQRIIEAVELITPHMLTNTWQELEYRLDICRARTGAHIEVYGRA